MGIFYYYTTIDKAISYIYYLVIKERLYYGIKCLISNIIKSNSFKIK